MKPTVNDFIEYAEKLCGKPLMEYQKILLKKVYESDGKLCLTCPPKMGYTLIMKILKGENK